MHIGSGYPLYSAEAYSRWHYYPPPYYSGGAWYYATPWLWYDGNPHGSYTYSTWQSKITTRMNQPANVTITMSGAYNPSTRRGYIQTQYRNDSNVTLANVRAVRVITEDSIYYSAPNGDVWHNHVVRDYLPNQNGSIITINAGATYTITDTFTLNATWVAAKCQAVSWLQSEIQLADSTKPIFQGGIKNFSELPIEEIEINPLPSSLVWAIPNPCAAATEFVLPLRPGEPYTIFIHDVAGREINHLSGIAAMDHGRITWNLTDRSGSRVPSGVYLFRFASSAKNWCGTVIVR